MSQSTSERSQNRLQSTILHVLRYPMMWIGLAVSRAAPRVPPSFAIVAVAVALYALSFLAVPRRRGSSASM